STSSSLNSRVDASTRRSRLRVKNPVATYSTTDANDSSSARLWPGSSTCCPSTSPMNPAERNGWRLTQSMSAEYQAPSRARVERRLMRAGGKRGRPRGGKAPQNRQTPVHLPEHARKRSAGEEDG